MVLRRHPQGAPTSHATRYVSASSSSTFKLSNLPICKRSLDLSLLLSLTSAQRMHDRNALNSFCFKGLRTTSIATEGWGLFRCSNFQTFKRATFQRSLKSFRMRTYKKSRGEGSSVPFSLAPEILNRPDGVGVADQERGEAKHEHGVAEAGAKVLPEGSGGAGVV